MHWRLAPSECRSTRTTSPATGISMRATGSREQGCSLTTGPRTTMARGQWGYASSSTWIVGSEPSTSEYGFPTCRPGRPWLRGFHCDHGRDRNEWKDEVLLRCAFFLVFPSVPHQSLSRERQLWWSIGDEHWPDTEENTREGGATNRGPTHRAQAKGPPC